MAKSTQLPKAQEQLLLDQATLNSKAMVQSWVKDPKGNEKGLRQLVQTSCYLGGRRHENRQRTDDAD